MRLRICVVARRAAPRRALFALALCAPLLLVGCRTPTSRVRLPTCIDRVTVTGQHHRAARGTLVFDHSLDLPFTRTRVQAQTRDGEVLTYQAVNSRSGLLRLAGGTAVGGLGGLLLYRYGLALADGDDALRSGWFWALPVGAVVGSVGGLMVLTGWHPPNDLVIDEHEVCRAPPAGAFGAYGQGADPGYDPYEGEPSYEPYEEAEPPPP